MPLDYTTPRYKCICPPGYSGEYCQHGPHKSCRGYVNGSRVSGTYKVLDNNMNPFDVFCHFDSNSTMAWTLVQSYLLRNTSFKELSFLLDSPVNENEPRWDAYRVSKSRMQSIQDDSNELRMTCKYDTDGMVYRDYVQATKSQVDIMIAPAPSQHFTCVVVDTINVRGHSCSKCLVFLARLYPYTMHFTFGCNFSPNGSYFCGGLGEDNFGFYDCINPAHRCSSSPTATTQTWLGGL